MDTTSPVVGPGNTAQTPNTDTDQAGTNAATQAAFDAAILEIAATEILTDHFVVTQPILDEINKESAK